MTSQQRTDESPPSRFLPSEGWIEAFEREYTTSVLPALQRFAARIVAGAGAAPQPDDYYPRQLALDAVSDTLLGTVVWNPATKELMQHLRDVVRNRAYIDWAHARKFRHESIDEEIESGEPSILDEADAKLLERTADPRSVENAAAALAELRVHAADDPDVLAYVWALEHDHLSRAEVMAATGLSRTAYHNARRRLARFVAQLSIHARPRRVRP